MSQEPLEDIETKILDYLRRVGAPNPASEIATQIHETRKDTLQAIERLIQKRILYSVSDLTLLRITGETRIYGLADSA